MPTEKEFEKSEARAKAAQAAKELEDSEAREVGRFVEPRGGYGPDRKENQAADRALEAQDRRMADTRERTTFKEDIQKKHRRVHGAEEKRQREKTPDFKVDDLKSPSGYLENRKKDRHRQLVPEEKTIDRMKRESKEAAAKIEARKTPAEKSQDKIDVKIAKQKAVIAARNVKQKADTAARIKASGGEIDWDKEAVRQRESIPKLEKDDGPEERIYSRYFKSGDPATNTLANSYKQYIDIFHIPSGRSVAFKAALTQFADNYVADWNQNFVFGRMDPIGTYKRTTRNINIGFSVQAYDFKEAKNNLGRMSLLTRMMYPAFDAGEGESQDKGNCSNRSSVIRGGPLVKMKLLNWASTGGGSDAESTGLLGWINGVSFLPDLAVGVFQEELNIYPKKFDINFTFTVVHQEDLGWNIAAKKKETAKEINTTGFVLKPFSETTPYNIDVTQEGHIPKSGITNKKLNEAAKASEGQITGED